MKERFRQFMMGRYGADQLSRFIMGCGIVTLILYMILRGRLWYWLTLVLLVWNYYRVLSRDHNKRYRENLKYLELRRKVTGIFRGTRTSAQDKNFRIYHCPSCHQKVRVPRGKGKISITCPKCRCEFIKRT
ncbi:hypothetical protein [Hominifimenecus sp. rT4P-3]|uniref:hypothetical protein n=1 Tax=Hominifimenecus sp. rT4P-3 TaxID=3242979 RepID=UPI003DA64831